MAAYECMKALVVASAVNRRPMVTRLNRRASPVRSERHRGAPGEPSLVEYVVNCISQLKGIVCLDGTLPIKLTPDAARRLLTPRVSYGFASPDMVRAGRRRHQGARARIGEGCGPTRTMRGVVAVLASQPRQRWDDVHTSGRARYRDHRGPVWRTGPTGQISR
jgi:hypothetical protein